MSDKWFGVFCGESTQFLTGLPRFMDDGGGGKGQSTKKSNENDRRISSASVNCTKWQRIKHKSPKISSNNCFSWPLGVLLSVALLAFVLLDTAFAEHTDVGQLAEHLVVVQAEPDYEPDL